MNKKIFNTGCFLALFLIIILVGINPVSADDKIIVEEIPDELSQKDSMSVSIKTTYPPGSFINYSFSLETPYPHRGKLSGRCSHSCRIRIIEDLNVNVFSENISLKECVPGDWKLKIWEEDHEDQAYVKMIHIFQDKSIYGIFPDSGTPDVCTGTTALSPELKLDPDPEEDGGNFAKGQSLNLVGEAPAESEIGVWIYSDASVDDFPVYKKISVDCNGNVDDEILSVFDTYTLPSGKYYVYVVYGNPGLIEETGTPANYSDFEDLTGTMKGTQYQKFEVNAEDPRLNIDSGPGNEIMTVAGTVLEFEGETNLKNQTILEVLINPTAVDQDNFGNLIKKGIRVQDNGPTNKWNYTIDTSRLGAGEYIISVESPAGLGNVSGVFNIFDSSYAVGDPGYDRLSVTSYEVDENTKDLKADSGEIVIQAVPVTGVSFPALRRI